MLCRFCQKEFRRIKSDQVFCSKICSAMSRSMKNCVDVELVTDSDIFLPTDAPPGSAEKVAILADRVAKCMPLFHKDDRLDLAGLESYERNFSPHHKVRLGS